MLSKNAKKQPMRIISIKEFVKSINHLLCPVEGSDNYLICDVELRTALHESVTLTVHAVKLKRGRRVKTPRAATKIIAADSRYQDILDALEQEDGTCPQWEFMKLAGGQSYLVWVTQRQNCGLVLTLRDNFRAVVRDSRSGQIQAYVGPAQMLQKDCEGCLEAPLRFLLAAKAPAGREFAIQSVRFPHLLFDMPPVWVHVDNNSIALTPYLDSGFKEQEWRMLFAWDKYTGRAVLDMRHDVEPDVPDFQLFVRADPVAAAAVFDTLQTVMDLDNGGFVQMNVAVPSENEQTDFVRCGLQSVVLLSKEDWGASSVVVEGNDPIWL